MELHTIITIMYCDTSWGCNMEIRLIRGDTLDLRFCRKNAQGIIKDKPEQMYFNVKKNSKKTDYVIQKKLGDGITYNEENNYYYFTIESSDTKDLKYGNYIFNIKVITNNKVKTICAGEFIISDEIAFMEGVV